jgi:uncharacterized protein YxeA
MKNFIYIIATVSLLISLASCTADEIKTDSQSNIVKKDVSAIDPIVKPPKI